MKLFPRLRGGGLSPDDAPDIFGVNCWRGPRHSLTRGLALSLSGHLHRLDYQGECRAWRLVVIAGGEYRVPCVLETGRRGHHRGRHRHADGTKWVVPDGYWPE